MKQPKLNNQNIWEINFAHFDRRSVKAQLDGNGDWRPLWWHLNLGLHRLFHPYGTLEEAMYAFHRRQQGWTQLRLEFGEGVRQTKEALQHKGIVAALTAPLQERNEDDHGQQN